MSKRCYKFHLNRVWIICWNAHHAHLKDHDFTLSCKGNYFPKHNFAYTMNIALYTDPQNYIQISNEIATKLSINNCLYLFYVCLLSTCFCLTVWPTSFSLFSFIKMFEFLKMKCTVKIITAMLEVNIERRVHKMANLKFFYISELQRNVYTFPFCLLHKNLISNKKRTSNKSVQFSILFL